jgi:hypothetical protein
VDHGSVPRRDPRVSSRRSCSSVRAPSSWRCTTSRTSARWADCGTICAASRCCS